VVQRLQQTVQAAALPQRMARFAPPERRGRAAETSQPRSHADANPPPREHRVPRREPGSERHQQAADSRGAGEVASSSGQSSGRGARERRTHGQPSGPQSEPRWERPAPRSARPQDRIAEEGLWAPSDFCSAEEVEEEMEEEEQDSAAYIPVWENDVLPLFYYNDLLAAKPGDQIYLNLFEPRYLEMCGRMVHDRRFLFMPNFEDYCCRVGDIGIVIRLSDMQSNGGRTYTIRGVAEEYAAVACTWVAPQTHGLHFARFHPLGPRLGPLAREEFLALHNAMLEEGWEVERNPAWRLLMRPPSTSHGEVLFGLNWPDRAFLLLRPGGTLPDDELLRDAWALAVPSIARPRFAAEDFVAHATHMLPPLEPGYELGQLCADLLRLLDAESPCTRASAGLGSLDAAAWRVLLSKARIAAVNRARVSFPNLQIELCDLPQHAAVECFPHFATPSSRSPRTVMGALNHTNVHFYSQLERIQVTAKSAAAVVQSLAWRLSRLRLRILHRAHDRGVGPLAALEDDVLRLVCDFVCPKPIA